VPVRAVFLDVGETLVDETRDWEAWADHLGVPRFTMLGVLGGIAARGEHHTEVFTRLAPGLDVAAADRERRARGLFDGFGPQDLYPDALPCLRALKAAGFRVGIAGNQPAEVEAFLNELDAPVDVVASSTSWGVEKPSPEFFLRVAMAARETPAEIAYVGDRVDNDVTPAAAAGMTAVFLRRGPWAWIQCPVGTPDGASFVISDLTALPDLLRP
jgi:HAD superfamily hydrolase (TIGR01662 family)